MKKSPTALMKEIKAINNEKKELYAKETRNSSIPVNAEMEPIYETSCLINHLSKLKFVN